MSGDKGFRRDNRRFRAGRAKFRQACEQADEVCHLCGERIDYTAPQNHPDAFELDHFFPASERPELHDDPANWRASHRACNGLRGNKPATFALGRTSRSW